MATKHLKVLIPMPKENQTAHVLHTKLFDQNNKYTGTRCSNHCKCNGREKDAIEVPFPSSGRVTSIFHLVYLHGHNINSSSRLLRRARTSTRVDHHPPDRPKLGIRRISDTQSHIQILQDPFPLGISRTDDKIPQSSIA